jgi:hypothetical protein
MSCKSFNQIAYVIALERVIYSLSMLERAIEVFFYLPMKQLHPQAKKSSRRWIFKYLCHLPSLHPKIHANMAIIMALILYTCVDCAFNVPQHWYNALPM